MMRQAEEGKRGRNDRTTEKNKQTRWNIRGKHHTIKRHPHTHTHTHTHTQRPLLNNLKCAPPGHFGIPLTYPGRLPLRECTARHPLSTSPPPHTHHTHTHTHTPTHTHRHTHTHTHTHTQTHTQTDRHT